MAVISFTYNSVYSAPYNRWSEYREVWGSSLSLPLAYLL